MLICAVGLATIGGPDRWMMLVSGCLNATLFCAGFVLRNREKVSK
jgi:hypothetical protein